jgi:O-antigen/teichoic acid export membrane protein
LSISKIKNIRNVRYIIKNGALILLANVFFKGVNFVLSLLLASTLTKNEFGILSFIRVTAATFEGVVSASNNNILVSTASGDKPLGGAVASYFLYIVLSVITIVTLYLFESGGGIPSLNLIELLILLTLFLSSAVLGIINSFYIGREEYAKLAKASFFSGVLGLLIGIFSITNFGFYGGALAFCAFFIIDLILKLKFIHAEIRCRIIKLFDSAFFLRSLRYFFSASAVLIFFWAIKNSITSHGEGFEELAEFELVYQFLTIIMVLLGAITASMIPRITKSKNKIAGTASTLVVSIMLSAFFSILLLLFGARIVEFINSEYAGLDDLIYTMALISIPFSIHSVLSKLIMVIGRDNDNFVISTLGLAVAAFFYFASGDVSSISLAQTYLVHYTAMSFLSLLFLVKIRAAGDA